MSGLWTRDDQPVFAKLTNYANDNKEKNYFYKFWSNSWIFSFRSFLPLGILESVFKTRSHYAAKTGLKLVMEPRQACLNFLSS